jgi:predicted porin
MKKVIVPTALLLGMAGAAQAQVTLYGLLDGSYGKSILSDVYEQREDFHSGGDNGSSEGNSTSRFGLKGTTDVGAGVKANFKLESAGITSNGSVGGDGDPFFNRQAWFGLSGNFGEFRLGRQDSLAFQTAVDYDFNGASNGVSAWGYTNVAPWNAYTGRQSRQLSYYTPTFGGVKAAFAFVPNGNGDTGDFATETFPDNKESYSAAVTYATGPLSVTGNYETERNGETGHDFASVVGSYDFGFAKVSLGYAKAGEGYEGVSTGLVAPVAGVNVGFLAAYNTDTDGYGLEVFANKEIYKNVIAYIEGAVISAKAPINQGNRTSGAFGPAPGTPKGDSSSGFALGLIYLF